jgi:hypothetical protein
MIHMDTTAWIVLATVVGIVLIHFARRGPSSAQHSGTQATKGASWWNELCWGRLQPPMICPHCQRSGGVRTKMVRRKAGISGAKATGAILTGGLSLLATGLSRKEHITEAHCDNCGSSWTF